MTRSLLKARAFLRAVMTATFALVILCICSGTQMQVRAAPAATLRAVVYDGAASPIGGVFQSPNPWGQRAFDCADINDLGNIAFQGTVYVGGKYVIAIFFYNGKTKAISKVAAPGDPNPLAVGDVFEHTSCPHLTSWDAIYFTATFHTLPTEDEPSGHLAHGIFRYSSGAVSTIVTTEQALFPAGVSKGYLSTFEYDVNDAGRIVIDGAISYYDPSDPDNPDTSWVEAGVYTLPPGTSVWVKLLIEGAPAPGGGTYGQNYGPPKVGPNGHMVRQGFIQGIGGGYYGKGTVLYKAPDGAWTGILRQGDSIPYYTKTGLPAEVIVGDSLIVTNVNTHGQVGILVQDPSWRWHFFVYSGGKLQRVAGYGDTSPNTTWGTTAWFWDGDFMTGFISDNRVRLSDEDGFSAEAVFQTPIQGKFGWPSTFDVYSYTSDGAIRGVILGDELAPDPPGGKMYLRYAPVAMNNAGQIVSNTTAMLTGYVPKSVIVLTSLDSDGDGLLDTWERDGIDIDGNGSIDFNLPVAGASPNHKDIFVEIDYMEGHRPLNDAINDVINAFDNAPVANPDGTTGVRLHVIIDDTLPHQEELAMWEGFDALKTANFGTSVERAHLNRDNILKARSLVFHYSIFGHKYKYRETTGGPWKSTTSSGMAELPGNDFLVSLGAFTGGVGSRDEQAGTFMHELGHTLNLRHGGGDDINCKPNYLSIMTYSRQFAVMIPDRPLDYSRSVLPTLDEADLNEPAGIEAGATDKTVYFVDTNGDGYNDRFARSAGNVPIDWNWDGDTADGHAGADLNSLIKGFDAHGDPEWRYDGPDSALQVMKGFNDWENIQYAFRHTAGFEDGAHTDVADPDMTWELLQWMRQLVAQQEGTTARIDLVVGLNLLTLPLEPATPFTAASLIDDIASHSGTVTQLDVWDESTGMWRSYNPAAGTPNFPLQMGRGVFLKVMVATTWQMTGTALTSGVTLNLVTGLNLVGMPYSAASLTAASLMANIAAQGGNVTQLDTWDESTGMWKSYNPAAVTPDFDIMNWRGYFLKATQASQFQP